MVQPVKRVLRWQLQLGEVDLPRRFRRLSRLRRRRLDGGGLLLRRFLLLLPEQQLRQIGQEEMDAYIARANSKYAIGTVQALDIHVDGDYVDLHYHLAPRP